MDACLVHCLEQGWLLQNPDSVNSDWTAVVMKKNRCPPNSPGCEAGKVLQPLTLCWDCVVVAFVS